MTQDEFDAMPVLTSFFPLTFISGKQKWTHMNVHCNACNEPIPDEFTKGSICGQTWGYRTSADRYVVDAYGLCQRCDKLTHAQYTLHSDMTITGYHPKTGVESRWRTRKVTKWEKFRKWLSKLFRT